MQAGHATGVVMKDSVAEMIDQQKVETILCRRFPSATWDQIAAAANAIMGLGDEWREVECRDPSGLTREIEDGAEIRVFRRVSRDDHQ